MAGDKIRNAMVNPKEQLTEQLMQILHRRHGRQCNGCPQ